MGHLGRYLLGEDFMGGRIGPEPTTDKFHVIMASEEVRCATQRQEDEDERSSVVPGNALVVDPKLPYRPLARCQAIIPTITRFGNSFLNRFQLTRQKNPLLSKLFVKYFDNGALSADGYSHRRDYTDRHARDIGWGEAKL